MIKRTAPLAQYPRRDLPAGYLMTVYGLAFIIIVMTTAQLITYERFIPILENYQFGTAATTKSFAAILVISAVLSLPFLLRMSLSPLLRIVSALSVIVYGGMWLLLGLWVTFHHPPTIGSGLLGGVGNTFLSSDATLGVAIVLNGFIVVALWLLRKDLRV